MTETTTVSKGQVVSMHYTLRVEGDIIDTSQGGAPFEFIQGIGAIIPGLEREMEGMKVGETKQVVLSAEDGYGEIMEDAFVEVPRASFPPNIPLEVGVDLQVDDQSGNPMYARIDKVGEETIRLDFNHPLAGKELTFDVEVLGLRAASEEELAHGHVHS
jgi:FKBP-type peptidyl-prolyl cis-trans isomerase SlyD